MKKTFLLCAATAISMAATAQTTRWDIDPTHSQVTFTATHLLITEVTGNFKNYSGNVLADKPDFSDAKVDFSIKVNSIDTDNEMRDNHLKSDDFFNAEKFPEMNFKGKQMKAAGKGKYKLTGDLTIRDVTKTIVLDVVYAGTTKDPWGNTKAGFKITGKINRFDYGLKWNTLTEAGGAVVGQDIEIKIPLQLVKAK
ncbi:MAG: YceI family protein [Bacteroidota bacterium]